MPGTLLREHAEALRPFGARVRAVTDGQWAAATPCTEWTVRDLLDHVTAEQLWVPPLVAEGRAVEEVGDELSGDVLGGTRSPPGTRPPWTASCTRGTSPGPSPPTAAFRRDDSSARSARGTRTGDIG
ncbi:maleylpyruvate isomerase N-terminal domain-containing protein [Streptomyces sp. NPDC051578]|uniref:maleylpyruvate isomerase N-terminal domain-containing protein n=1 Tax=Streptomyces sp. NPDC051578 TaxID=3365662 RepID=UPI00378EA6EA